MIQGNQAYVYHHSATGHTLAITDKDETIVNQYAYSPYGRLLGETETSGLEQPFKYVGKYGVQHEGDELYYMRARYYDADTGRFTMEDPIGIEGGLNVSLYGNANPVVFVDPSGEYGLLGAVIGGVSSAVGTAATGGSVQDIAINGLIGMVAGFVPGGGVLVGAVIRGTAIGAGSNLAAQAVTVAADPAMGIRNLNLGSVVGSAIGGALTAGRSYSVGGSRAAIISTASSNAAISATSGAIGTELGCTRYR